MTIATVKLPFNEESVYSFIEYCYTHRIDVYANWTFEDVFDEYIFFIVGLNEANRKDFSSVYQITKTKNINQ